MTGLEASAVQAGDQGTIAIVTDATADVPQVERDGPAGARAWVPWIVLPELWRVPGDIELPDDGSPVRELMRLVLDGESTEPQEPGWDEFCAAYHRLRDIDRVFSIHSPASVSWAVERAREAAGAYPNVRVIEANVTGIGLGLLASTARDVAVAGAGPDATERWLRRHRQSVRMLVVPDRFDPKVTQRGLSTRLLASQPTVGATAGAAMDRTRRLRSRRATVAAIERYFTEHTSDEGELRLALGHGDAAGAVDPFLDLLERLRPHAEVVLLGRVGPRLVQQLRSRCVAAAWLEPASADAGR